MTFLASFGVALALIPEPPPPVPLRWDGPPECPSANAIYVRLGPELEAEHARVDARVGRSDGGSYIVDLTVDAHGEHLERALSAPSCDALVDAVVVVVTLVLERARERRAGDAHPAPLLVRRPREEALARWTPMAIPAPPPPPLPMPPRTAPNPAHTHAAPSARPRYAAALGLGLATAWNLGPATTGGPTLGVGLAFPRGSVGVIGRYWAPQTARRDVLSARVQAGDAALEPCIRLRARRRSGLRFPLCASLSLGALRVDPGPELDGGTVHSLWGTFAVVPGIEWRRNRSALRVSPLIQLPWVRRRFRSAEGTTVFRTPALSLGLELRAILGGL